MRRRWTVIATAAALLSSGCVTMQTKVKAIVPGTSKAVVMNKLGTPLRTDARDEDEALQYCRNGPIENSYATVWLSEGVVKGVTTSARYDGGGGCRSKLGEVDWTQMPTAEAAANAPEKKSERRINNATMKHRVPS
jgi:hypothetical protein